MRRRSHRKQPQKQPICIVTSNEQASSSFPFCVPLFYSLLFAWIAFFALNPVLSPYAGSHPRSGPWLSGVQADIINGKQKAASNTSILDIQSELPPVNESTASSIWRSSQQGPTGLGSVQGRKCKPLLFKDLLYAISFSVHCSKSDNDKKKSSVFQQLSRRSKFTPDNVCIGRGQASLSRVNDTGNNGACNFFNSSSLPHSQEDGHLSGSRQVQPLPFNLPEGQSTQAHIDDSRQNDQEKLAEHGVDDPSINSEEFENSMSVDNHTGSSLCNDTTSVKESTSAPANSDIVNKTHPTLTNLSRIHLRQEPGDGPYNYAADSKGAKILAYNKEAKGASNILNKDKDKYFRTPCNVEAKFLDMELSEEMLVVEIAVANHEFYSSNVREFAFWGSLTYPTEEWVLLGKFEAENNRVVQTFRLKDPQWVRYLKLQMLSHYGTDFYCTLSVVEVYGVDAIEWFLEDWIAEESGMFGSHISSPKDENLSVPEKALLPAIAQGQLSDKDVNTEEDIDFMLTQSLEDTSTAKSAEFLEGNGKSLENSQPVYHQTGRPALDAVMKLLMQKVRTLEHKQPSFSRSLGVMEARYRDVVGAHSNEAAVMMGKLESAATEIANLKALLQFMDGEWKQERRSLEEGVLDQVKAWNSNFEFLRYQLKRTEDKELVALAVSLFSIVTVVVIQGLVLCLSAFKPSKEEETMLLACKTLLRAIPLSSCVLVVFVLSI
ncbi:hypothetical protein L7F22_066728 [Adiantum nelumboides]|nr:hypothetical protein [Adiantum nelumboides]